MACTPRSSNPPTSPVLTISPSITESSFHSPNVTSLVYLFLFLILTQTNGSGVNRIPKTLGPSKQKMCFKHWAVLVCSLVEVISCSRDGRGWVLVVILLLSEDWREKMWLRDTFRSYLRRRHDDNDLTQSQGNSAPGPTYVKWNTCFPVPFIFLLPLFFCSFRFSAPLLFLAVVDIETGGQGCTAAWYFVN